MKARISSNVGDRALALRRLHYAVRQHGGEAVAPHRTRHGHGHQRIGGVLGRSAEVEAVEAPALKTPVELEIRKHKGLRELVASEVEPETGANHAAPAIEANDEAARHGLRCAVRPDYFGAHAVRLFREAGERPAVMNLAAVASQARLQDALHLVLRQR
jgi:hypothetical protein